MSGLRRAEAKLPEHAIAQVGHPSPQLGSRARDVAHEIQDRTHGRLRATSVVHPDAESACLFLYGGGGDERTLVGLAPLLREAWAEGALAPMAVTCLGVPPWCFYLDDPRRGLRWETAVAESLLATLPGDLHGILLADVRDTVEAAVAPLGLSPQVVTEARGWAPMLHFVAPGIGLAVINAFCRLPRRVVARPIPELARVRYFSLVAPETTEHESAMALFDALARHRAA